MHLTLFTSPKPFEGRIGVIQRNAIRSWQLLGSGCEILLCGNEQGTAEAAREFSVGHVAEVALNEFGTPRLDDLFRRAQERASHDVLCYVNADIILMADFLQAAGRLATSQGRFLMIGRRFDLDLDRELEFDDDWESQLRSDVRKRGVLHIAQGIDYFVFRRGTFEMIPPFALGRTVWDHWLIYDAVQRHVRVIDVTPSATVVHQNHAYQHPEGKNGVWHGPEALKNRELAGRWPRVYDLRNAGWILTRHGLLPAITPERVYRRVALWVLSWFQCYSC
jgi:hypothetical protein